MSAGDTSTKTRGPAPVVHAIVITIALFSVVGTCLGFFYGWLDDVLFEQNFRGVFTGGRGVPETFNYLRGTGAALTWLYAMRPGVPWYGLYQWGLLAASCVLLFHIMLSAQAPRRAVAPVVLLVTSMLIEYIMLNTFTVVSMLLPGAALIEWRRRVRGRPRWVVIGLFVLLVLGYLNRPGTALLAMGFVYATWWIRPLSPDHDARALFRAPVLILLLVTAHMASERVFDSPDKQRTRAEWSSVWATLDDTEPSSRMDLPDHLSKRDSTILFAVRTWYFQDTSVIGLSWFQRHAASGVLDGAGAFDLASTWTNIHQKACCQYTKDGQLALNWWDEFLIFFIVMGCLLMAHALRPRNARLLVLLSLGLLLTVVLLTHFLKIEDRVFTPLAILSAVSFTTMSARNSPRRIIVIGLLVLTASVNVYRVLELQKLADYKRATMVQGKALYERLLSDPGDYVILDYFSRQIIHGSPFEVYPREILERPVIHGDPGSTELRIYREHLRSIGVPLEHERFYRWLLNESPKTSFLIAFRSQVIARAAHVFYDVPLHFVPRAGEPVIHEHPFLWNDHTMTIHDIREATAGEDPLTES